MLCRESDTSDAVMQGHVQRLRAAQARMLELSEQVSVAELATEMSEARAKLIELNSGKLHIPGHCGWVFDLHCSSCTRSDRASFT